MQDNTENKESEEITGFYQGYMCDVCGELHENCNCKDE